MRKWAQKQTGFTIVELLIVIVVIAILAAITVVAFNGIQKRAQASAVGSSLNNAVKKIKLYQVDSGAYPTALADAGVTDNATTYQYSSTITTYCITGTQGSTSLFVSDTQSTPTAGGCAGHGQGGVSAITNMAFNPSAFSSASSWSGWGGNGGGVSSTTSVAAVWATRGRAARNTWTVANTTYAGDLGWQIPTTGPYVLMQNTQYTASWKVQTSKSQRLSPSTANYGILGGAAGTGTGTINSSSGQILTNALTPVVQWITFTTGPNTVYCKVYSSLVSGAGASTWNAGDYIEISDFMLTQGSTQYGFADGNSANWVWSGTANASTSTGPAP